MIRQGLIYERLLVEKLITGDPDSFTEIFKVYYRDLVIFANSFTNDFATAEEIVQDTFIKIWEDREILNIKVSLKSYLLKTVQNKCINWHRRRRVINNYNSHVSRTTPLFEYDTDNYILLSEMKSTLKKAYSQLPEKLQETYKLHRSEGLKYSEIAEQLNISVKAVEARMSKALSFLRKKMIDFL
ncbi:MAG: RNA polymerase sigma-70 factor [Bacteroidales bacterium]|nr:RNA polymerase sigma-70 factor [Bacteroidales bacterium]